MPFHENFWLAVGAAAPVITLAIVVVVPDAAGLRFRADRHERELVDQAARAALIASAEKSPGGQPAAALGRRLARLGQLARAARLNVRLCYANLIAQAALLAVSLAALAYSRDLVPPWLAIIVAVGGVGLLAWTLLRGAGLRDEAERLLGPPADGGA